MPKAVFQHIYADLKARIDAGEYAYQSFLPSENDLTQRYGCSRSSVRRTLALLAQAGYVQSQQGKGVRVIRNPSTEFAHGYDGLETFRETAIRRGFEPRTKAILLEGIVANEQLAKITGFRVGSRLTHIKRVRYADDAAVGTDESFYLSEDVPGLTLKIVGDSVYDYLENVLGMKIVTSMREVTVEPVGDDERELLDLDGFNAVALMRCHTFNADGIMIEYTETRQRPGFFSLYETVTRPRAV